jgi:hypothetical protein
LAAWPALGKYLRCVRLESLRISARKQRLAVIDQGGSFDEEGGVATLMYALRRKMRDYQWPVAEDIRLLTFYDQGFRHNAPIYAPFRVNAEQAADRLRDQIVPFKHIYLIFGRSGEAYEIHPNFSRCA